MPYYDEKYRNEKLLMDLLRGNTLDQLLFAFDPANFRQTPQPLPLYNPNPTGQGGPQGGSSYLDQLLAGQQAPAQAVAPVAAAAPIMQILQEEPKKRRAMMDGGGMIDRGGYGGLGMSGY